MLVIDRFEGDYVVIEYGDRTFDLPRDLMPKEAKEGDVVQITVVVDKEETDRRREKMAKATEDLFE